MYKIAFFDFDGTITKRDSFRDFLVFSLKWQLLLTGVMLLLPYIVLYLIKVMPNYKLKEKVIHHFYKGWDFNIFEKTASDYSKHQLPRLLKKSAMERLNWHKSQGHRVVIVTASLRYYISPWCDLQGIDLIATEIETKDGKITGRLGTKNCYGAEKVRRIRENYNLNESSYIYTYGDTKGDREMLQLANERYYRHFKR
ncbi:MAG: HAD-IB family hydrolase [Nitrospirae bacterium]|nr:HAD-IB family hydrolase [Nitrospirota bacterium]